MIDRLSPAAAAVVKLFRPARAFYGLSGLPVRFIKSRTAARPRRRTLPSVSNRRTTTTTHTHHALVNLFSDVFFSFAVVSNRPRVGPA